MNYYIVDAFTQELFRGNPAGVCILEQPIDETIMQKIAFENNLSETAFVIQQKDHFDLRWFTPNCEIDLCGHATLASAHVLFHERNYPNNSISFHTQSGVLTVLKDNDKYTMDFPSRPPTPCDIPSFLEEGLGVNILETHLSRDLLVLIEDEQTLIDIQPNFQILNQMKDSLGIIVTAPSNRFDFVSRFFIPNFSIPEDPVTGSAHSTLIPFWSKRLKKNHMVAAQLSKRGGILCCENCGDRVKISGKAISYLKGELLL